MSDEDKSIISDDDWKLVEVIIPDISPDVSIALPISSSVGYPNEVTYAEKEIYHVRITEQVRPRTL